MAVILRKPMQMSGIVLDLHNHSSCSYDASNHLVHYRRAFRLGLFDVVAITDHNTTRARRSFLNDEFRVIIGQEIDTRDGELVGLFLDSSAAHDVALHRSAAATAREIRARGGIVYLQHPFYRWLKKSHRMAPAVIDELLVAGLIDVVEVANGGALMAESNRRAAELAQRWGIPGGAGSDAHHPGDIGRATVRIPFDGDPFALTKDDMLAGLAAGQIDTSRVRPSILTLGARVAYTARSTYGRLGGAGRKLREPRPGRADEPAADRAIPGPPEATS